MKKGYFFDIDGTLYDNTYHEISEKTFGCLQQLHEKDYFIAIATSRVTKELSHLPASFRKFPFDVSITDGGTLIVDSQKKVLYKNPISVDLCTQIDTYCKENNIGWRYATVNENYFGTKPTRYMTRVMFWLYLSYPVYKAYEGEEVFNILVYVLDPQMKLDIRNLCKGCSITEYPDCLEIRASGISKADAIEWVKEKYGLDHITCFGDGDNDCEMLEKADTGIAMGNAREVTKKAADEIIDSIKEEGIYHYFLEKGLCKEEK